MSITEKLRRPFDPSHIKWKPQSVRGNQCLAVAYIDARLVQERLDEVFNVDGWQDSYELLPDGSVACRLSINVNGQWITKMDVGSQSEQKDGGDRLKSAFSDALKRAATKLGIGRYLYALPLQWVQYDPQKRTIVSPPRLPDWAIPKPARQESIDPKDHDGNANRVIAKLQNASDRAAVARVGTWVDNHQSYFGGRLQEVQTRISDALARFGTAA